MAAWFPVSQWTPSMISTYRQAVVSATPMLVRRRARFTCEDFALGLVIDFAANNRLPLLLANETYPNGMRPEQWSTLDAYRNDVLSTTGARDLLRAENTVPVSSLPNGMLEHLRSAQPGDIIFLESGGQAHIQVVTGSTARETAIVQGNTTSDYCGDFAALWHGESDPASPCYNGFEIREYEYDHRGYYSRTGRPTFRLQSGRVRRWNFASWNALPAITAPSRTHCIPASR